MIKTVSFILAIILIQHHSYGQTKIAKSNKAVLDSMRSRYIFNCKTINSSRQIRKKEITYDKKLIKLINYFYAMELPYPNPFALPKGFRKIIFSIDSINLGGTTNYDIAFGSRGNLRLTLSFASFENNIIYKQLSFETASHSVCDDPQYPIITALDFDYIENICLTILIPPISIYWNSYTIAADTTYLTLLQSYKGSKYNLSDCDSSKLINYLTWHDLKSYTILSSGPLVPFIKAKNTRLLEKLLYSPNYLMAIYAMEGLLFLEATEGEILDNAIHNKMNELRDANIPIIYQSSDVVYHDILYRNLEISTEYIIKRFTRKSSADSFYY